MGYVLDSLQGVLCMEMSNMNLYLQRVVVYGTYLTESFKTLTKVVISELTIVKNFGT